MIKNHIVLVVTNFQRHAIQKCFSIIHHVSLILLQGLVPDVKISRLGNHMDLISLSTKWKHEIRRNINQNKLKVRLKSSHEDYLCILKNSLKILMSVTLPDDPNIGDMNNDFPNVLLRFQVAYHDWCPWHDCFGELKKPTS